MRLDLIDARRALVSDNFYWRDVAAEDDFTALARMPTVTVETAVVRADRPGVVHLDVTLSNPSQVVALMAHVQLRRERSGERVLPVSYSDNYVSLLPGERRSLSVEAASRDLAGDAPRIAVDGWNVTARAQTFAAGGRSSVAPNLPALVAPSR